MPYKSNSELPKTFIDSLPKHGQDIYRESFNKACEEHKEPLERRGNTSREETALKVVWSAVKKVYEKDSKGNWGKKKN